jgi:tetratricopeptide (TPR) repeat protein
MDGIELQATLWLGAATMMKADQLIATIDQRLKAAGQKIRVEVRGGFTPTPKRQQEWLAQRLRRYLGMPVSEALLQRLQYPQKLRVHWRYESPDESHVFSGEICLHNIAVSLLENELSFVNYAENPDLEFLDRYRVFDDHPSIGDGNMTLIALNETFTDIELFVLSEWKLHKLDLSFEEYLQCLPVTMGHAGWPFFFCQDLRPSVHEFFETTGKKELIRNLQTIWPGLDLSGFLRLVKRSEQLRKQRERAALKHEASGLTVSYALALLGWVDKWLEEGALERVTTIYKTVAEICQEHPELQDNLRMAAERVSHSLKTKAKEMTGKAAVEHGRALVELFPANPDAHQVLGQVLLRSRQLKRGEQELRHAIRLYGERLQKAADADSYVERGNSHAALGEWALALADYERALQKNPAHAGACHNRGIVWAKQGRLNRAKSWYLGLLKNPEREAAANYGLACVYTRSGDTVNALKHLETAIQLDTKFKALARADEDLDSLRRKRGFKDITA